jgi:hypothetical protein
MCIMEKAYLILHFDKETQSLVSCGIYSEWPLTKLNERIDVCVFCSEAKTYDEAYKKLTNEILNFPMVSYR